MSARYKRGSLLGQRRDGALVRVVRVLEDSQGRPGDHVKIRTVWKKGTTMRGPVAWKMVGALDKWEPVLATVGLGKLPQEYPPPEVGQYRYQAAKERIVRVEELVPRHRDVVIRTVVIGGHPVRRRSSVIMAETVEKWPVVQGEVVDLGTLPARRFGLGPLFEGL